MPLYEYLCLDCGAVTEALLARSDETAACGRCGSPRVKRLLSAPSSLTGYSRQGIPGPGDTACCGSTPDAAQGCAGPGSCCGQRR